MTMPTTNGILDLDVGQVFPPDLATWTTAATWADFSQWILQPDVLDYALDPIDLGSVRTFCLNIKTDAVGLVSYIIYTSNTGAFAGEETITMIDQGDVGITAFTGQYVWIEVTVTPTAGVNVINNITYSIVERVNKFSLNNVNSSTLGGTVSARQIALPKSVSAITNIQITPQQVTSYNLDVYVTNTPTSTYVVPKIISKGGTPTFALVGIDNHPRDAVVDILVEYLPEGYMSGNDLLVR